MHSDAAAARFLAADPPAPPGWRPAAISVHDHWLTEAEAGAHWMSFTALSGASDPRRAEYDAAEAAFMRLCTTLVQGHALTHWTSVDASAPEGAIDEIWRANLREQRSDLFRSNPLGIVIRGGWDLTFPLYLDASADRDVVTDMVRRSGLFLLS